MKNIFLFLFLFQFYFQNNQTIAQLYFPPNSSSTWDTIHPDRFGWCSERIDELYSFLDQTNTDAFILLKDGKIVLEKYFGTFTKDSLHTWNSAGKVLTAFLVGITNSENLLDINLPTSNYLGNGWTSLSVQKENTITLKHQLTMTTGLDDSGNLDCTDPNCLTYMADVGTRWSYHNAPYTLLGSVIEQVSGVTLNSFVASKVNSKIGAFGIFNTFGYNQVYISTPRSMARFGLLLLANGNWNGTAILNDPTYLDAMHNTSQNFNLSYGYLTWLNGKNSYMIPQSQFVIPGKSIPSAPDDLYAALGKNSQIINVVPSKNMVLIRMGDGDGISLVSNQYNDSIWKRINSLNCVNNINEFQFENIEISPNPSNGRIKINVLNTDTEVRIFEMTGKNISVQRIENEIIIKKSGVYIIELQRGMSTIRKRVIVEN